MAPEDFF